MIWLLYSQIWKIYIYIFRFTDQLKIFGTTLPVTLRWFHYLCLFDFALFRCFRFVLLVIARLKKFLYTRTDYYNRFLLHHCFWLIFPKFFCLLNFRYLVDFLFSNVFSIFPIFKFDTFIFHLFIQFNFYVNF